MTATTQTNLADCPRCGRRTALYYFSAGICDDCKWDSWIPTDYQRRERYVYSEIWKHHNATRRPKIGADFLDLRATLTPQRN